MDQIPMGEAQVQKDLIEVFNGNHAEAIYFNRPEKQVVCFSTQLNCAVGCAFCASPDAEKTTVNLTTGEMLNQIYSMMSRHSTDAEDGKVVLFSFMGEGEPLLNYKNVLGTMRHLEQHGNCRISVSTSGVATDRIVDLAREKFSVPFKLQVSIHSMDPDVREWLIPLAKPIDDIAQAIHEYHMITEFEDRPVELNFALLKGVNDSIADAEEIADTFPNEHIKISQFNPIIRSKLESASDADIGAFVMHLRERGVSVEYHMTDGSNIGAACGQTRGMRAATRV